LLATVGSVWFIIDSVVNSGFDVVSYGVWIAMAAGIVGFIFAILMASFSKGRKDW